MRSLRRTLSLLFLISGFCGLLYQVVWVRLAMSHFGVITPVLSVVVSVFMLGLALGSWAAGRWINRWTHTFRCSAIVLYGLTEGLIGLGAFAVPALFRVGETMLLPGGEMNSFSYLTFSGLIIGAALLPWCFAMGMTFPLMTAYIKERMPSETSGFSQLYLANVIGAVLGTILTADVLVELLGFRHTLWIAAGFNFLIMLVSLWIAQASPRAASEPDSSDEVQTAVIRDDGTHPGVLGLILFTTGLVSMSLEVVWTRAFTPVLNTTIYAFALILAVYLIATAVGSYVYRRDLRRQETLSLPLLTAILAITSFLPILLNDPRLNLRTFGVEAGIFPMCAVLGYLTPSLIDSYSRGNPGRVGDAYAVNVVGCIVGPLIASYFLLPQFGVKNAMVCMALLFAALMVYFAVRESFPGRTVSIVIAAGLLICAVAYNRSYEEKYPGGIVRRDSTATVISVGSGMAKRLYVNGQGITVLSTITKEMAHMPLAMLAHPPRSALDICFGMGATYRALLSWPIDVTAVELVPSVRDAFGYYFDDADRVRQNPQGRIVIDDGRRFLKRTSQQFDVITLDPPPPVEAAASSLLYSREFYQLVKARLAPGGILQQWFPGGEGPECAAITRSLDESFPFLKIYRSSTGEGIHFLASMQPLPAYTAEQLAQKLPETARKDLLEWETTDAAGVFQKILSQELSITALIKPYPQARITDDRPYNEYYLLRRAWARYHRAQSTR